VPFHVKVRAKKEHRAGVLIPPRRAQLEVGQNNRVVPVSDFVLVFLFSKLLPQNKK